MIISKPPENKQVTVKPFDPQKGELINKLLKNRITPEELDRLRRCPVTADDLSDIIQHIYDLNEKYILELSRVEGLLRKLDDIKNRRRNKFFIKKIKSMSSNNGKKFKVILAEGDSWFNYPLILTDIIDRISMENDFAVYSLASGGDWLLNMLTARHYVEELSILHPDVFLISGGGNDLVGSRRLAAVIDTLAGNEFHQNKWAEDLIKNAKTDIIPLNMDDFTEGVKYLSKDFFALVMFFYLQYSFLISGILNGGKFPNIQIITQGYDYPIPSYNKGSFRLLHWYVPFVRNFLGHGSLLKTPLLIRGITNPELQRKILYAMIYLFNEMMIQVGYLFNETFPGQVFHIDSRGSVGNNGWTDELHPLPKHFIKTGEVFVHCIRKDLPATFDHTYVVGKISS